MTELSNKSLALLLVAAIVISLGGTIISLNKLNQLSQYGFTGFVNSAAQGTTNFSLQSNVVIIFSNALVSFGTGYVNSTSNANFCEVTTNASYGWNGSGSSGGAAGCLGGLTNTSPFYIQNIGNENVNLTLNASANATGFVTGSGVSPFVVPYFQWALTNNASQTGACLTGLNDTWWTNVSQINKNECTNYQWVGTNNTLRLDIRLVIPVDATQILHTATITATGTGY